MSSQRQTTGDHRRVKNVHAVFTGGVAREQMRALAADLLERRELILDAWRAYGENAPGRNVGASLSRAQFNDHIPAVLDTLGHTLETWPDAPTRRDEKDEKETIVDHGSQRWQQGYQLTDLVREWGYLQMCVAAELERYAAAHPSVDPSVMPAARLAWAKLCAEGVTESASEYGRLQQSESAGHVSDLERMLSALKDMERSRAENWRTAAHDLRGSVTVVQGATALLNEGAATLPEPVRAEVADMLNKRVASLQDMLNDLLSLARLEAGQERREISAFDAAVLLRDFCTASQAVATERGLFLKMDGPGTLLVEGDKPKVLRILQNLLLNAVKYTQRGGISVTWGVDEDHGGGQWTFSVKDTGPGLDHGPATPLAQEIHDATVVAETSGEDQGDAVTSASTLASHSSAVVRDQPGEGVGLSIVKRLCDLLGAGLEFATEPGQGSTFRVTLPRSYGDRRS